MAIVIGQIVTETALASRNDAEPAAASTAVDDERTELIIRRATERVLETLRREWDA